MIIKLAKKGMRKKLYIHKMMKEIGEPMTTRQILFEYNKRYTRGFTMNELANVLSKTPIFEAIDFVDNNVVWDIIYFTEVIN